MVYKMELGKENVPGYFKVLWFIVVIVLVREPCSGQTLITTTSDIECPFTNESYNLTCRVETTQTTAVRWSGPPLLDRKTSNCVVSPGGAGYVNVVDCQVTLSPKHVTIGMDNANATRDNGTWVCDHFGSNKEVHIQVIDPPDFDNELPLPDGINHIDELKNLPMEGVNPSLKIDFSCTFNTVNMSFTWKLGADVVDQENGTSSVFSLTDDLDALDTTCKTLTCEGVLTCRNTGEIYKRSIGPICRQGQDNKSSNATQTCEEKCQGAIGGSTGGVVIIVLIGGIVYKKKKKSNKENPESPGEKLEEDK